MSVRARHEEIMEALDRLLGTGLPYSADKIAALRTIERTAKRMADNCERGWSGVEVGGFAAKHVPSVPVGGRVVA